MKIGGSIYEMVKTRSIPLRIFPFGTIKRNVSIEIGRSSQFARSGYFRLLLFHTGGTHEICTTFDIFFSPAVMAQGHLQNS